MDKEEKRKIPGFIYTRKARVERLSKLISDLFDLAEGLEEIDGYKVKLYDMADSISKRLSFEIIETLDEYYSPPEDEHEDKNEPSSGEWKDWEQKEKDE